MRKREEEKLQRPKRSALLVECEEKGCEDNQCCRSLVGLEGAGKKNESNRNEIVEGERFAWVEVECIAVAEAAADGGMSIEEEELESTVAEEEELVGFRKEDKQHETEDTSRLVVSTAEERIVVVVIAGSTAVAVDTVPVPDLFSLVSLILLDPPRILVYSIERGKMKAEGAKDTGDLLLLHFLPHSLLLHNHLQHKNSKIQK